MENNKEFWNKYVQDFESNPNNKQYQLLGQNWKGENIFIDLLKKYSNPIFTALEIGCGGGRITNIAKNLFAHIIATDISSEMIRKASTEVQSSKIKWLVSDGFTLDNITNTSQDFVYSHDVFVHFSSMQVYPYLVHIRRILKNNGIGILSFYNFTKHFNLFKNESLRFNKKHILPPSMRHHFITQEMLLIMLTDLGFEIIEFNVENFLIVVFQKKEN